MNWLVRLKNIPLAEADATKATKSGSTLAEKSFVGSVAPTWTASAKIATSATAMNDSLVTASNDPDRWCYPHSIAMNTAEIETFTERVARFTELGATQGDAENMADVLVIHDRKKGDMVLCLKCGYLQLGGGAAPIGRNHASHADY